jgi:hypothetical protein
MVLALLPPGPQIARNLHREPAMHPSDLPPDLIARLTARRGRRHMYDQLVPSQTALVVIDMQAAFTDARSPLYVPAAVGVAPAITRMANGLRAQGGTVAWVGRRFRHQTATGPRFSTC